MCRLLLFISMKTCNICNIQKPLDQFYKHKKTKDGRQSKCKECEKSVRKATREKDPGHYYKLNSEYYKEYYKKYNIENKDKIREITKRHYHKKLKHDILYRLRASIGSRMRKCLKTQNKLKLGSAVEYLGCDYEQLKKHLELQFTNGMCWTNYGKWEIDHIIPLSKNGKFHYTNLQPLWRRDNQEKSNKILDNSKT
jgi:hypothetical protein